MDCNEPDFREQKNCSTSSYAARLSLLGDKRRLVSVTFGPAGTLLRLHRRTLHGVLPRALSRPSRHARHWPFGDRAVPVVSHWRTWRYSNSKLLVRKVPRQELTGLRRVWLNNATRAQQTRIWLIRRGVGQTVAASGNCANTQQGIMLRARACGPPGIHPPNFIAIGLDRWQDRYPSCTHLGRHSGGPGRSVRPSFIRRLRTNRGALPDSAADRRRSSKFSRAIRGLRIIPVR
jgi:hypothetical protein